MKTFKEYKEAESFEDAFVRMLNDLAAENEALAKRVEATESKLISLEKQKVLRRGLN